MPMEAQIVAALAREHGLDAPADALHVLLRDVVDIYDTLWDKYTSRRRFAVRSIV